MARGSPLIEEQSHEISAQRRIGGSHPRIPLNWKNSASPHGRPHTGMRCFLGPATLLVR